MICAAPLPPEHTALLMTDAREERVAAVGSPELLDGPSALTAAADPLGRVRGAGHGHGTAARVAVQRGSGAWVLCSESIATLPGAAAG